MPLATEQTLRFSLARSPSPPIKIISISTWKLRSNYFFVGCIKNPCTMNLKKRDNAIRDFIIFRCNQQTGQKSLLVFQVRSGWWFQSLCAAKTQNKVFVKYTFCVQRIWRTLNVGHVRPYNFPRTTSKRNQLYDNRKKFIFTLTQGYLMDVSRVAASYFFYFESIFGLHHHRKISSFNTFSGYVANKNLSLRFCRFQPEITRKKLLQWVSERMKN